MRRYIYRNAYIAASDAARIIVRNDDAFAPLNGIASLSFLSLVNGALLSSSNFSVNLPRGGGVTVWSCADPSVDYLTQPCPPWSVILQTLGCATDGSNCIAMLTLRDSASGTLIAENFELLQPPSALVLPTTTVTATVSPSVNPDGSVDITLTTSNTAIFVTMTTLAQGRFSDNAIFLSPGNTTISFIPWSTLDLALLTSSLRVEHAGTYPRNV
jgi:beta-mannosidase